MYYILCREHWSYFLEFSCKKQIQSISIFGSKTDRYTAEGVHSHMF